MKCCNHFDTAIVLLPLVCSYLKEYVIDLVIVTHISYPDVDCKYGPSAILTTMSLNNLKHFQSVLIYFRMLTTITRVVYQLVSNMIIFVTLQIATWYLQLIM